MPIIIITSWAGQPRAGFIELTAARVSDRTAFFTTEVDTTHNDRRTGRLIEFDDTEKMFANPDDQRTENYVTGRFG